MDTTDKGPLGKGRAPVGEGRGCHQARTELAELAHKLAGSSLNVGAHRVAALCRILERDAAGLASGETTALLTQLELEVGLANAALAQVLLDDGAEALGPVT